MQRMMKIVGQVDFATRNAPFGRFAGNEECTEKPDEPFQWERMQCGLKVAMEVCQDGDIINAHDKIIQHDKGKNEFGNCFGQ